MFLSARNDPTATLSHIRTQANAQWRSIIFHQRMKADDTQPLANAQKPYSISIPLLVRCFNQPSLYWRRQRQRGGLFGFSRGTHVVKLRGYLGTMIPFKRLPRLKPGRGGVTGTGTKKGHHSAVCCAKTLCCSRRKDDFSRPSLPLAARLTTLPMMVLSREW